MIAEVIEFQKKLMLSYQEIETKFRQMPVDIIGKISGNSSAHVIKNLQRYGDGYPLRGIPKNCKAWNNCELVVCFIVNFPVLCEQSVFNPYTPIEDILYWKNGKELRKNIIINNRKVRIQHLVYEQITGVSGKDICHAKNNQQILKSYGLYFERVYSESKELLNGLLKLQESRQLPFIVFTNAAKNKFGPFVTDLFNAPASAHIEAKLYGDNRTIMTQIKAKVENGDCC